MPIGIATAFRSRTPRRPRTNASAVGVASTTASARRRTAFPRVAHARCWMARSVRESYGIVPTFWQSTTGLRALAAAATASALGW